MDLVILDWTRMGRTHCLAGAAVQRGEYRIVRPLSVAGRANPIPNQGWWPELLEGHVRWQRFEMVGPEPGPGIAPHLEDVWVGGLKPRPGLVVPEERRAILRATLAPADQPLFGATFSQAHGAGYTAPGTGKCSLTTATVPSAEIHFTSCWREGAAEPDFRATFPLPGLGTCILPVKDHFLLRRAEMHSPDADERIRFLARAVRAMGDTVAVRLGLSRPFASKPGRPGRCWLMADGFFSLDDPQP